MRVGDADFVGFGVLGNAADEDAQTGVICGAGVCDGKELEEVTGLIIGRIRNCTRGDGLGFRARA